MRKQKTELSVLNEPPAERLVSHGERSLSNREILAIVIGGSRAKEKAELLANKIQRYSDLIKVSLSQFVSLGLTRNEATRIVASFELGRRKQAEEAEEKLKIKSSKDIADIFRVILEDLDHEEFWIMFLDRANNVITRTRLSQGGISGTVTDVRMIMRKAIEHLASSIIVCHNHPSGNKNPSESDERITRKIKESGSLMDVQLLDHIIICGKEHYSFADNGLL